MSFSLEHHSTLYDPPTSPSINSLSKSLMSTSIPIPHPYQPEEHYSDNPDTSNGSATLNHRFEDDNQNGENDPRYYSIAPPPKESIGKETIGNQSFDRDDAFRWRESKRAEGFRGFLNSLNSRNQILFLVLLAVQSIVILTMIITVFVKIQSNVIRLDPALRSITTYITVFIFACIFETVAAVDALRLKNVIQLIFLVFFNIAITAYSGLIPSQVKNALKATQQEMAECNIDPNSREGDLTCFGITGLYGDVDNFLDVIPIVGGVGSLVMIFLAWKLYGEFGWDIYKKIGADIQLKRMYFQYQIFVCFLKFDFFFFIGFSLQYLILVLSGSKGAEFGVTIAAIPISIVILIIAAVAVRLEMKWLYYLIFLSEAAGLAYFIYKLFRLWEPSQAYKYENSRKTLTTFSVISVIMLVSTIIASVVCFMNFGRGLKEQIPPYFPRLAVTKKE